jgi:hypothetical protein
VRRLTPSISPLPA